MTVDEENSAIFVAIGEAITAWGGLEQALSILFGACCSPCVASEEIGYVGGSAVSDAVFHANDSLHAKLAMLTAAIAIGMPPGAETDNVAKAWDEGARRIRQYSKKRNRLAHWSVTRFENAPQTQRVRLMPPMFDPARRGHGGHTIADIQTWSIEFRSIEHESIWPIVRAVGQHKGLHAMWTNAVSAMLHNLIVAGEAEQSLSLRDQI